MTRRGVVLTAVLVGGVVLGLAPSVSAVKPARQGWWRASTTIFGIDLTALLDPSSADVPADGLLVAGGTAADQPQAIAAVAYDVAGTVAGPLRLTPHPAAATVPGSGAMACPLDEPTFTPAQGGLIADAPRYDCLGAVVATVDPNGAYLFDVTTLVRGGALAVAILPTSPTSRIVFATPADDSLAVDPAPIDTAPAAGGGLFPLLPAANAPQLPPSTVSAAGAVAPDGPAPSAAAAASSPAAAIGAVQAAPRGSAGRAYFLLGLAAAAGLAWAFAGRARRPEAA